MALAGSGYAENAWGPVVSYWDTAEESDGIGFGAFFSFGMSRAVNLDLRASWFSDLASNSDLKLEVIPLEAGLSFVKHFSSASAFHVGGGLGYYLIDGSEDDRLLWDGDYDTDDEMGLYAVAGFEFTVADDFSEELLTQGITLFIEAGYRYVNISDSDTGLLDRPALADGALDGLTVNAGLRFLW